MKKHTINLWLMAALVCGLGLSAASCSDDDDEEVQVVFVKKILLPASSYLPLVRIDINHVCAHNWQNSGLRASRLDKKVHTFASLNNKKIVLTN